MLKDTGGQTGRFRLCGRSLGQAQVGLKKYDEAEASYKKALELEAASKKPTSRRQGAANAGLGEIYARTGKVPEANAAYDAAAKVNPAHGRLLPEERSGDLLPDEQRGRPGGRGRTRPSSSIPPRPLLYYLKGQGLVGKATIDAKTQRIVLPPGCAEAYQKYLELAPNGPYAADVKGILDQAGQKVDTSFKAAKTKKK